MCSIWCGKRFTGVGKTLIGGNLYRHLENGLVVREVQNIYSYMKITLGVREVEPQPPQRGASAAGHTPSSVYDSTPLLL
jgi:hypothetical protein